MSNVAVVDQGVKQMRSVAYMSPEDRKEFARMVREAEKLPENYLLCRCVGHAWSPIAPDRIPPWGRILTWECVRCSTKRDDIFDNRYGKLSVRTYRYAEGYIIARPKRGEATRLTRTALRVVFERKYNG